MRFLMLILGVVFFTLASPAKTCEGTVQAKGSPFHFAFENLKAFDYLNHAVAQLKTENPGSFVCYSAVIIYLNTQQYNEYLFEIEITHSPLLQPVRKIRLLFQDGPIQAYHNALGLPWIGLDNTKVNLVLSALVFSKIATNYENVKTDGQDPLDLITQTKNFNQAGILVIDSVNAVQFSGPEADHKYFLVTWLKTMSYNHTKDMILPQASIVIVDNNNRLTVVEDVNLFSEVLQPLTQIVQQSRPAVVQFDAWVLQLKNLSAQF